MSIADKLETLSCRYTAEVVEQLLDAAAHSPGVVAIAREPTEMPISVQIDIAAASLEEVVEKLEEIVTAIGRDDEFGACCSAAQQRRFGGTVFVTTGD